MTSLPSIVIVGRPNVGKSTLFNAILGQRRSIVGDEPGVVAAARTLAEKMQDEPPRLRPRTAVPDDAPLLVIGEGTNELQRIIIARQLAARNPA